ncbi:Bromodomain-containing protein [Aspergillus sp. HF37]|nr:Bromodomain-containing protein [Aspergillus sp. HF37]
MPPPSAYTPFESLLFFQSVAALDSHPTSFVSISDTLRNNSFIRQNVAFNPDRLSPEALEELYTTLMRDGLNADGAERNGRAESPVAANPRKRKIASPRPEGLVDGVAHATIVPDLVSRLYARYKDSVTREIKSEEKRFSEIRDEIERLQKEEQEAPVSAAVHEPSHHVPPAEQAKVLMDGKPVQQPTLHAGKPPAATLSLGMEGLQPDRSRQDLSAPQLPATAESPKPGQEKQHQPLQPVGMPQEPATQQPQRVPAAPPGPVSHPFPANGKAPSPLQGPSVEPQRMVVSEGPTKVSPLPQPPIAPPLQAQQGPNAHVPSQQPIAPVPQGQQISQPSPLAQPHQTQHPSIPQHALIPQPSHDISKEPIHPTDSQQGAKLEATYQNPYFPAVPTVPGTPSAPVLTPLPESRSGPPPTSADGRRSLTPWKSLPRLSIPDRQSSPARPRPEDISPISARAPSPAELPETPAEGTEPRRRKRRAAEEKEPSVPSVDVDTRASKRTKAEKHAPATRKKRDGSTPSSKSRRSVVSREEGSPTETTQERIKHEATNTPAGIPEEVEPSARADPDRKGGAAAAQPGRRPGRGRPKRKRSVTEPLEPEPAQPEPSRQDPHQYVLCARNFPRTGAPIMNDVTTHKHGSIFTKPLTEREAPGYRDLIYRPQDLKSIKSCINQGSKAVSAASEAASTPAADGESPVPAAGTPSKNAVLMLQKSEDIVPPKAIVNSAQLEKELIRMFANAVMYNPTPQHGFGPAFPMIRDGGSRTSPSLSEPDEGGIVNDAMEMFDDVEKAVTKWRAAERTADELGHKSVLSVRRGSAGDLNMDSADDSKA